ADSGSAIRRAVVRALGKPLRQGDGSDVLRGCVRSSGRLIAQLRPAPGAAIETRRRRDFFSYSLRRQWRPLGPSIPLRQVHAVWGELAGSPVMGIIIGPDRPHDGVGVADAHAVLQAVKVAADCSGRTPAPIVTFLFCRGHATTLRDERAGLPRALADCLR